jgi:hypothetical protein
MSVSITKATDTSIKFRVYDDYMLKNPIELSRYIDIICAITEDGRLLLEKKYSQNAFQLSSDLTSGIQYIATLSVTKDDTQSLSINPANEERVRTLELFGIDQNRKVVRFIKTEFYLEGSGYYVR